MAAFLLWTRCLGKCLVSYHDLEYIFIRYLPNITYYLVKFRDEGPINYY